MIKRYRQILRNIVDDRIRNGLLVWRYRLTRPGRLSKPIAIKVFRFLEMSLEKISILQE